MSNSQYPSTQDLEKRKSSGDRARLLATASPARGATASRTGRRELAAQVLRLAKRLGRDPEELASRIPADTMRRLKYPVLETVNADGSRSFKHDPGIEEATRTSLRF